METETQGIDARAFLGAWMNGLTGMYLADINAIPDDKWTATHGGCTKSASELTSDAISLVMWTAEAMKGNYLPGYESDLIGLVKTDCATKEGAAEKLQSVSADFCAALAAASDETLSAKVNAPWGMESPLYGIAQVAASHLWYHDGQLNYIQCLLGDDKIHWMG